MENMKIEIGKERNVSVGNSFLGYTTLVLILGITFGLVNVVAHAVCALFGVS